MNRFAEFRTYSDNTTCGSFVCLFPILIIKTRSIDNCLFRLELVNATMIHTPNEVRASRAVMTRLPNRTPSNGMQGWANFNAHSPVRYGSVSSLPPNPLPAMRMMLEHRLKVEYIDKIGEWKSSKE